MHLAADVVVFRQTSKGGESSPGEIDTRNGTAADTRRCCPRRPPWSLERPKRRADPRRRARPRRSSTARNAAPRHGQRRQGAGVYFGEDQASMLDGADARSRQGNLPAHMEWVFGRLDVSSVPGIRKDTQDGRPRGYQGCGTTWYGRGRWADMGALSISAAVVLQALQSHLVLKESSFYTLRPCAACVPGGGGGGANEGALILAAPIPQRGRWGSLVNAFLVHRYMY